MYTLEQLQQKTFKELKEIGWQLNVLPAGDRRCRQNWIDAIADVQPPLLELLEVSPGVEVEPVAEAITQVREIPPCDRASEFSLYPADFDPLSEIDEDREAYYELYGVEREDDDNNPDFRYWLHGNNRRLYGGYDDDDDDDELAAQPIAQTVENSPGVEIEPVAEAIEIQAQETRFNFDICWVVDAEDHFVGFLPGPADEYLSGRRSFAARSYRVVEPGSLIIKPIEVQATEPIEEPAPYRGLQLAIDELIEAGGARVLSVGDKLTAGGTTLTKTSDDSFFFEPAKPATEPIESKFGRIVYPKPAPEPIAQTVENSPGVSFDVEEFQQAHVAEIDAYVASFTDDRPPNRGSGDRGRIEPKVTQSALKQTGKKSIAHQLLELFKASALIIPDSPAAESEPKVTQSALKQTETSPSSEAIPVGIALSDRFLARYAPPQPEQIHFKVDADGQLSLLDFELSGIEEPPDPDDYDCMFSFWAAYDAWCDRFGDESFEQCTELDSQCTELDSQCTELDSQCTEPIQIELASMVEWAPCLDEYEPETIETIETSSITLEISSMLILSEGCANESFDTCDFSIPTFDVWCDRPIDTDEPPDTGIFARRPLPKPPSFPPMAVVAGDRANRIKKFARSATFLSGRAPPGGDASF
ncbi:MULTISPECIES: hypothetical protein [unclassified Microcoleus]|uniref:hypothetical protein n=1 Tax=unclassified Microcoleus TaxID=2642155 RepID=UPI001DBCD513|nr:MULTISPECIES: hypothetical protein [unclassified Microcoleus]TAE44178.1 MAG: hypothetical protein EAZ90_07215 [Oscillatoriales cyanobacterium]MCC3411073.1 hypothetical protein [Microcoleus sp. PH2017_02_FOX_O_A]MCC3490375.1 hypothetical protein [Microcoleus sp. PH2017_16_JOR_D_A]MCC3535221.1 hypothetical protein [Microcoleus sp. PH2017_25_DOB_D_A]MCC3546310.1 hypothetical protein [Microcoleus sp. PH2017_24_DOB_U_A]